MAVTFFPFNSIVANGVPDRPANAENLAAYLSGFFSNGVVMQEDTALRVVASSGMNVQINAGMGNINGKTILNDAAKIVPLAAANASQSRIDRVVFRLDEVNRLMEFDVLTGTPASSPTAPALTRTPEVYEMCLAEIRIPAGATSIATSYITDRRSDTALCGAANIPKHIHNTKNDRQNINYIGLNPIAGTEEDTVSKWASFGTGVAYIDKSGLLKNQPSQYGFIATYTSGANVFQIWYRQNANGPVYKRAGGLASGWYSTSWVKLLDENSDVAQKVHEHIFSDITDFGSAESRQAIKSLGQNPIASTTDDTPANWTALGTGHAYISGANKLNGQPVDYGIVESTVYNTVVAQVFTSWATGSIGRKWSRIGNQNYGWSSPWREILTEENGIQRKELWTNASPTSSFGAQTITAEKMGLTDLSEYDAVEIDFNYNEDPTYGVENTIRTKVGNAGYCTGMRSALLARRTFSTSNSGIVFQDAGTFGTYGNTNEGIMNTILIPIAIYGIKGVQ